MVEFLQTVKHKDFAYEEGKRYVSIDEFVDSTIKDTILVRQPNSPKNKDWWTRFPTSSDGVLFKTIDDCDMTLYDIIEEDKVINR